MMKALVLSLVALLGACGPGDSSTAPSALSKPTPTPTATPSPAKPPAPIAPTNFVIINIDNLDERMAQFDRFAQPKLMKYMPTINAFAGESLIFDNYHTTTPLCTPSRYSLLTGNYASRATNQAFLARTQREGLPVVEMNTYITQQEPTLPKRMQALGFRTGFFGKDHATEALNHTFATKWGSAYNGKIKQMLADDQAYMTQLMHGIGFDEADGIYMTNPQELPTPELMVHNLDWIADGAIKFIQTKPAQKFFLYVALTVAHEPLEPKYSWNADPLATPFGFLKQAPTVMPARSTLTPRVNAAGYPGAENWLWLDDAVGAIVKALKDNGSYDNTAIFLISDNGMNAPGAPHDRGTHTAGFVHFGNIRGRTSALLANIDIMPTILAMAGGTPAGDGFSMVPILNGSASSIRPYLYTETGYARKVIEGNYEYVALRHSPYITALAQQNGWTLSPWLNEAGVPALEKYAMTLMPNYVARDQFYNLATDPSELKNLYGQSLYQSQIDHFVAVMQQEADKVPHGFKVK
jgi:arylsulfatase A-like enzyme